MPPSPTPSDPNNLLARVKETLTIHSMLTPGNRVLVGVSGGPDSMALLHLLSRLAPELKLKLGVAHLNHGLRGASADRDAQVVRQAAADLGFPFHMGCAHVIKVKQRLGLSLEEAARRIRHAFFRKIMADPGYHKLALGHHMDDNAEQMLMVLLRGVGPRGLSGIVPVRENRIIRPLINACRAEIEAFVAQEGITCVLDESNDDLRFLRNRIRHHLLPLLASDYNPRVTAHLNRLADVMRTEETWIQELTAAPYEKAVIRREKGTLTLSADAVAEAHPALARRLIRLALQDLTGTLQRITFSHVQSVIELLVAGGGEKELHLPRGIRARRSADRLMLFKTTGGHRGSATAGIDKAVAQKTAIGSPFPAAVRIKSMGIGLRFCQCRPHQVPQWVDVGRNQAYFDLGRLSLPLTVRRPIPGDRFTPLGMAGSQKVNKFFIDHRITRQARATVPVLADAQRIIWLMGQRIDDHVKVTTDTSQVLGVEFFLLDTR